MPSVYLVKGHGVEVMLAADELISLARFYGVEDVVNPCVAMARLSAGGFQISPQYLRPDLAEHVAKPCGQGLGSVFREVVGYHLKSGGKLPEGRAYVSSPSQALALYDGIDEQAAELLNALFDAKSVMEVGAEVSDGHVAQIGYGLVMLVWSCIEAAVCLGIDLPAMWAAVGEAAVAEADLYSPTSGKGPEPPMERLAEIVKIQLPIRLKYGPPKETSH